jgi:hypothetical protein
MSLVYDLAACLAIAASINLRASNSLLRLSLSPARISGRANHAPAWGQDDVVCD